MAVLATLSLVLLTMTLAESGDGTQLQESVDKHSGGFLYLLRQVSKLEDIVQEMKIKQSIQLKNIEDGIEEIQSNSKNHKETTIQNLSREMESFKLSILEVQEKNLKIQQEVNSLKSNQKQGTTYVRWGRTLCPTGTETVYKGTVGGSYYEHTGAAANYICLTNEPEWGKYDDRKGAWAKVYGGEYQFDSDSNRGATYFGTRLAQHDAPCVVCRPPRPSTIMIPGRKTCYAGWTLEYSGYLVADRHDHVAASEYVCLDERPETRGSSLNQNGKLFYLAEGICGTLPCPPYVDGRELTCVVCSK